MKIKVIQINTSSSSLSVEDYEKDIERGWYAQVGFELKKQHPELEIECWAPERKFAKEQIKIVNGIKFRTFPASISIRHGMEISLEMLRALKKEQRKLADGERLILHFHEYHSWLAYSLLLNADKRKAQIVCQHHGGRAPFENLRKHKKLLIGLPVIAFMQLIENISLKKVNAFYALSDEEENYLKKTAPLADIRFQTMGISDEYFRHESKLDARRRLRLDKNKKYILYIGRIKTTKGIRELLDAMKKIGSAKFELLLIGKGVDFAKYKDYARNNKIENAKFLGQIYGKEKFDYLSACDCMILPSYTEGAPVVIMEALARGLPVIATNVGGIPKMIENSKEGIIITPKSRESIVKAIKEITNWEKKNMIESAEKYKWKKIIKQTASNYEKWRRC